MGTYLDGYGDIPVPLGDWPARMALMPRHAWVFFTQPFLLLPVVGRDIVVHKSHNCLM